MKVQKLPLVGYIYASFVLIILTATAVGLTFNNLPPVVPLLFGLPTGMEQLVKTPFLFAAPGSALIITILNTVIAVYLKDEYLKKILAVSSLFISLLSAITVVKIILLVGFR